MTDDVLEVVEVVEVEVDVEVEDDEDDDRERTNDEEVVAEVVSADDHTRQINSGCIQD
jgi:hypothetical protein